MLAYSSKSSCSYVVHSNSLFSVTKNPYFLEFIDYIRLSYIPPTRYVLSHTIMDSEYARVSIEEIGRLKQRNRLTLLFDGWEDKIRRSLYGSIAAEVRQYPTVLSLNELTGHRGSADKYLETVKKALKNMEIENGENLIALTTDDPTIMQSFRRKFKSEYYWVIVSQAQYKVWIYPDDPRLSHAFCMVSTPSSERLPHTPP